MRQAWVRQLWKARPQHRGPRLVCDEVGPPPAVPLHSMRGNAQHEHGNRVPRSSLHVELLRCYYNFIRPHRALRFGRETRTPAMQAGLVSQRLALRDIFTAGGLTRRIFVAVVHVSVTVQPTESDEAELSTRCSPSARRQAA